jgi:hypothetical protein
MQGRVAIVMRSHKDAQATGWLPWTSGGAPHSGLRSRSYCGENTTQQIQPASSIIQYFALADHFNPSVSKLFLPLLQRINLHRLISLNNRTLRSFPSPPLSRLKVSKSVRRLNPIVHKPAHLRVLQEELPSLPSIAQIFHACASGVVQELLELPGLDG